MTTNDTVNQPVEDKASADTHCEEQSPFQVVLIDLKKAAQENEIVCVEKTLMGNDDLKFLAVSYRWGELLETTVDTGVGYLANITSFDLDSFFLLCRTMAKERDLQYMDYIWVDAICVNQTNYERRKATIYQMTNIYHRANYIVAVPDFHLGYLKTFNKKNAEIIQGSQDHAEYIYHLIHGNMQKLYDCDLAFLNTHHVPQDKHLRYLLTKYTDNFVDGFTNCRDHDEHYDDQLNLQHIYQTNMSSRVITKHHHGNKMVKKILNKIGMDKSNQDDLDNKNTDELHKCDDVYACPIKLFHGTDINPCTDGHGKDQDAKQHPWKRFIPERSFSVRQSMYFLADLILDWSSRVWVISEYHIAKMKQEKKMKYWFIQLGHDNRWFDSFFEFDFGKDSRVLKRTGTSDSCRAGSKRKHESTAVYQSFHAIAQRQLKQQTFLEKILKSKARRNEDRLYAILPLTEYKHKLTNKEQVDQWQISDQISIKLQLYDWMTTKDRLELLFLSSHAENTGATLPSFASSKIMWPESGRYPVLKMENPYTCNFNMTDRSIIQLINNDGEYKLNIKPKEYYRSKEYQTGFDKQRKDEIKLSRLLHLDPRNNDMPDMICIPNYSDGVMSREQYKSDLNFGIIHYIFLIGCFEKNKWIIEYKREFCKHDVTDVSKWEHHYCSDNKEYTGFEIY